jgi:hypothetical protein
MSSSSEAIMHVPSYADYLNRTDQTAAYAYEVKLLKLLQWQKPGKYWVLKSPHHMEYLDIIHRLMPDLKLIWTHRDPKATIPSYMSMLYHGRRMFSDDVAPSEITEHWVAKIDRMLAKGLNDAKSLPAVKHVLFHDLIGRETEVLGEITDWIGGTRLPDEQKPKTYKSHHNYHLEDWGLSADGIDDQFDYYLKAMKTLTT